MRVGLVCPYSFSAPGGVQNHVLGLAGWLQAHGHEPVILAPGAVPSVTLANRGLAPEVMTSLGGTLALPWNGSVARVAGGPRTALRVRSWLAENHLDVLHVHEPVSPSAALWALLQSRLPLVGTFHLAVERSRLLSLAGQALADPLTRLDQVLAVSDVAARAVRHHLELRPRIVPNGIDMAEFAGTRGSFSPPKVLFLGRLTDRRKGLAVLLDAVPRIHRLAGAIDIGVAGPGNPTLPHGVQNYGPLDDQRRAELLRNTDVLIAPHLHGESFGLVLVEAMAAGTKVVASDLPAFTAVLTDPEGGTLGRTFPTGDPVGLARAIAASLSERGPT
ncbi:MAG: glycosyltransferase family 4 protein, partial [Propionibacteriaceae bacterium]|nr:glycosyltransferase family 4 protein [Propionibacteriaceae bacterium]